MSATILKVTAIGNLGADPEVFDGQKGPITSFSIAHNEAWKGADGQEQERTEWVRVKTFGKLAEVCAEYLTKGRQVYIEGTLRTDKYEDKEGIERVTTYVVANEVKFLSGGKDSGGGRNDRNDRDDRGGRNDRDDRGGREDRQPERGSSSRGYGSNNRSGGGSSNRTGGGGYASRQPYGRTGTDPT